MKPTIIMTIAAAGWIPVASIPAVAQPRTIGKEKYEFRVVNPTDRNRQEVVELDVAEVYKTLGMKPMADAAVITTDAAKAPRQPMAGGGDIVVTDGDGLEMPYQITQDGKLLVEVTVGPNGVAPAPRFTVMKGVPHEYVRYCTGRVWPERLDDLSWETDRNAWRLYGPAMDGKATGFDVFVKNTPEPVQEEMYRQEMFSYVLQDSLRAHGQNKLASDLYKHKYTYHKDHGRGMDAYTVGMTLGAGAPCVLKNTGGWQVVAPTAYEKAEITETGPLRFSVRLEQRPQDGVKETRVITQDKGSHLARVEVEWDRENEVGSGIVVHKSQPEAYVINPQEGYVAYSEAMDTPQGQNGQLFIACLYPQEMDALEYLPLKKETAGGIGHVVGRRHYRPGETFRYYVGTAWSRNDIPTMGIWEEWLRLYNANMAEPLRVEKL